MNAPDAEDESCEVSGEPRIIAVFVTVCLRGDPHKKVWSEWRVGQGLDADYTWRRVQEWPSIRKEEPRDVMPMFDDAVIADTS